MKFSQLSTYKLEQALNWTRSHDWGRDAGYENGCIVFRDIDGQEQSFDNLTDLKNWAGY